MTRTLVSPYTLQSAGPWRRVAWTAWLTAIIAAAPMLAMAQAASTAAKNPAAAHILSIAGWVMIAVIGAFCVVAIVLSLSPAAHRE